jgi:hypothetical protein
LRNEEENNSQSFPIVELFTPTDSEISKFNLRNNKYLASPVPRLILDSILDNKEPLRHYKDPKN